MTRSSIGRHDKFWVVTDPMSPWSGPEDCMVETTLDGLARQIKGGLTMSEHNPLLILAEGAEGERQARAELQRRFESIAGRFGQMSSKLTED